MNIANGHIEKSRTLKTEKSKLKYLALAKEALQEGIQVGRGNATALRALLEQIEREQAALARNGTHLTT